jgi:hypothetical protein
VKKAIGLGMVVILVLLFSVSCGGGGVAQDKYDKVNSDLAAKTVELKTATDKLALVKSEVEIFNTIFLPAMRGDLDNMSDTDSMNLFLSLRDKVIAVGDSELTTKFQAIIDSAGGDEPVFDFFIYLLEDISKELK